MHTSGGFKLFQSHGRESTKHDSFQSEPATLQFLCLKDAKMWSAILVAKKIAQNSQLSSF
jgi:hypothetical protein